jgi:ABC-type multidrug transport system ATPase subunit
MAIINDGRVLAAGTVKGLKQDQNETLEDVFIRLVGRSIEDLESDKASQESEEDSEEE